MNRAWSLAEVTELDLRLHTSADADLPSGWEHTPSQSRSSALHQWLQRTRASDPEASRLASAAVRGETMFRLSLFLFSLLAGMGAATGLLRYGGERIINVSAYLGVFIGGQLLLLAGLLVSGVWLHSQYALREELFLPKAVRDLPVSNSYRTWRWRLFTTFQIGGVAFNLGVLAATLWKVVAFDLAFGWATTLRVEVETVSSLVQILAAPWGGAFTPAPVQIAQSRIILLEGFSTLDPESTAAWWPFLMMSVTVYGLFPRIILMLLGRVRLYQCLRTPHFSSPHAEHLYQRLTRKPLQYDSSGDSSPPMTAPAGLYALQPSMPMVLDIPEEIACDREGIRSIIETRFSISLTDSRENSGILLLIETWQPPLEEFLRELKTKRRAVGTGAEILLLAVGLPDDQGGFHEPDPGDLDIWSRKLSELEDPKLGILAWSNAS